MEPENRALFPSLDTEIVIVFVCWGKREEGKITEQQILVKAEGPRAATLDSEGTH